MRKVVLLVVMFMVMSSVFIVNAETSPTNVYLATTGDSTELYRTQETNLVLKASNMLDLYSMQVEISYDPQRLELNPSDIINLAWQNSESSYTGIQLDSENGILKLILSKKGRTQGISGDINLLGLKFTAKVIGKTIVNINTIKLTNSSGNYISIADKSGIEIDVLPNPLSVNLTGIMGKNEWYTSEVNIEVTDIDAQEIKYTLDGVEYVYTEPFTFEETGAHTLVVTTNDGYGFIKEETIRFKVDNITPEITVQPAEAEWQNSDIIISPAYSDQGESGLSGKWYKWTNSQDEPAEWLEYTEGNLAQQQDGIWYLHTKAEDAAGNLTVCNFGPYKVDKTIPSVTVDIESREVWDKIDMTVVPTFNDEGGSNIKAMYYEWSQSENIAENWTTYTSGSLTQSLDGAWYLNLKVEDNAGNVKKAQYGPYKVDKTAPVVKAAPEAIDWINTEITIAPEYTDLGGSEIASRNYAWSTSQQTPETLNEYVSGNLIQTQEGIWYLHMRASDNAGNVTIQTYGPYKLDLTVPTIAADIQSRDWDNTDMTVVPTFNDEGGSNIKAMYYEWSQSENLSENWTTYTSGSLTQTQDGVWFLNLKVEDNAGNVKIAQYGPYKVDKTAPVLIISGAAEGMDYTEGITPVISISDSQSGIAAQSILLEGQEYTPGTPITEQGTHVLSVWAVDFGGNEQTQTINFKIYASTSLTLTAAPCDYSDNTTITAQLVSRGESVVNGLVSFRLDGVNIGIVETDMNGIAVLDYIVSHPAGTYLVEASYEQDDARYLRGSQTQSNLVVSLEKNTILYTGQLLVQYTNTMTLSAQVIQENDGFMGDYTLTNVSFEVSRISADGTITLVDSFTQSCDASGMVSVERSYEVGLYSLRITASSNGYFVEASDIAIAPVYDPNGGFATGGGWIDVTNPEEGNLGKANFGFIAKYKDSSSTGNLEFQYKDGGINLKSIQIDWLTISSTSAQFQGIGTIKGMDGIYTFRVSCTDNKDSKKSDKFTIKIWAGTDTDSEPIYKAINQDLGGGNILVKTKE